MSSLHCTLLLLLSVVIPLTLVSAYSCGPPITACAEMFPAGHNFRNANTTTAPYRLTASANTFSYGQNITLTLTVTGNPSYPTYLGMFVQARKTSNCNDTIPIGTFSIPNNATFLRLMNCSGGTGINNAVSHKINSPQTLRTFTWTAPSTGVTGHIFFRATVVYTKEVFWTNVFTGVIKDLNDATSLPTSVPCQAKIINTLSPTATLPAPTLCASSLTTLLSSTTTRLSSTTTRLSSTTTRLSGTTTRLPLVATTRPTGSASSMAAAASSLCAAFVIFYTAL